MSNFAELNTHVNSFLVQLISSQNLCKLLTYPSDDPYSEATISDTSSLLFSSIYPFPKIPTVADTECSLLTVIFDKIRPSGNPQFKDFTVCFNIFCHIDTWRMEGTGKLRPYAIMQEIDTLFNDERIAGIGTMKFKGNRLIGANQMFWGYALDYEIVDFK